ncbi:MAG: hypothetical protein PWP37_1870, partial [Thermotogota bacterium]|nr:hypothetical protein [Thermotogota bacterium]
IFLEAIVCECLRGEKRSTTAKTSRWNIPFLLCVRCFVDAREGKSECDHVRFVFLLFSDSDRLRVLARR